MNIEDLSSNSKLLMKFIGDDEKTNTVSLLASRAEMSEEEVKNSLTELEGADYVIKYNGKYLLILTDEQQAQMDKYYHKKKRQSLVHTISFSKVDQLRKSKRKFFFKYITRFYPQREIGTALTFGIFSHDLIENTFESSSEEVKEYLNSRVQNRLLEFPEDEQETIGARFFGVIPNLIQIRDAYDVIELERRLEVEIMDVSNEPSLVDIFTKLTPKKYRVDGKKTHILGFVGYVDGWLRQKSSGLLTVADWKTGNYTLQKFKDNAKQVQIYVYAMRMLGENPRRGVIVYIENVIVDKDTGVERFAEYEVDVSEDTCKKTFDKMVSNYLKAMREGIDYKNFGKCCQVKYQGWCEYRRLCHLLDGTKLDSALLRESVELKLAGVN